MQGTASVRLSFSIHLFSLTIIHKIVALLHLSFLYPPFCFMFIKGKVVTLFNLLSKRLHFALHSYQELHRTYLYIHTGVAQPVSFLISSILPYIIHDSVVLSMFLSTSQFRFASIYEARYGARFLSFFPISILLYIHIQRSCTYLHFSALFYRK